MNEAFRSFEAMIDDVKEGERSVVAKINTDSVDRYKTVIMPQGVDLTAYRKNPVVLWEHGKDPARGTMPIARNQWIKPTERGIVAKTIFRDDAYADMLFRAYQDGGLRGWSVRMLNPEYGPPTEDELRSRPDWAGAEAIFRQWEMGEYSGVAVPGNSETLTLLASRGIWIPDDARTTTDATAGPAVIPVMEGEAIEPARYIRKKGSKWIVYSEAGKVLGKHDSEADAKAQLGAIEAHKHDKTAPINPKHQRYVDTDGTTWFIRDMDGTSLVGFSDYRLAQECLRLMDGGQTLEYQLTRSLGEIRSMAALLKEDIKGYIDLYRHGRV